MRPAERAADRRFGLEVKCAVGAQPVAARLRAAAALTHGGTQDQWSLAVGGKLTHTTYGEKTFASVLGQIANTSEPALGRFMLLHPGYLDALAAAPKVMDVATQIPHAALRFFVMGDRGADHAEVPTGAEIAEMGRLGVALGGNPMTFAGLAGMGDLIATCSSRRSRNNSVGIALGRGRSIDDLARASRDLRQVATRAGLAARCRGAARRGGAGRGRAIPCGRRARAHSCGCPATHSAD